jgi:hypothetical protein
VHLASGAKPEYSYWAGKKYGYVAARKLIYAPLYASLVSPCSSAQYDVELEPPIHAFR